MLEKPDLWGAYTVLKWWYHHVSARAHNPSREDMKKFTGEYTTLYQREDPTPPGRPVTTYVKPFRVNEDVPLEAEV